MRYDNFEYRNTRKAHQSGAQKFLRALLTLCASAGFGLFWYSLVKGINNAILLFLIGMVLMVSSIIHIFIGIKKDADYRNGMR